MTTEIKISTTGKTSNVKAIHRVGCGILVTLIMVALCAGAFSLGLAPKFVYDFPERFLPPYCDEQRFAQIIAEPPTKKRVVKDLYGATRVIAVDDDGNDFCFFRASTHPQAGFWPVLSPNQNFVAFTSNQFTLYGDVVSHLFVVDTTNGLFSHISDTEGDYEELAWSPDSTQLAYTSDVGSYDEHQTTFIGSITPSGESIWKVDLGTDDPYWWGYLEWTDDGSYVRYGHEETSMMGKPISSPFWCVIMRDGSEFNCETLP